MMNKDQYFDGRDELRALLKNGKYTTLALSDGNDSYVLTLSYGLDESEDVLYFHSSPSGNKLDYFKSNPYLCGTVIRDRGYDTAQHRQNYESVVYFGLLEVIHRREEKLKAMQCIYRQQEGNIEGWEKLINGKDDPFAEAMIMKLSIDEMSGRKNSI